MFAHKNYVFLALQALAAIGLLSGCIITDGTTGTTGAGGSSVTSATAAATTSGTDVGVTSTTGTGGAACVGETGAGVVDDCNHLNITPVSHGGGASAICGTAFNEEPPGYNLCTRGFTIFNPGAATTLVTCLGTIGVQDECKAPPLQTCVEKMFADQCEVPSIKTSCEDFKTKCGNDPFDAAKCATELNPFSNAGTAELADCMNKADPALTCQQAYDGCYTKQLTF
jgi:hypothetical protein